LPRIDIDLSERRLFLYKRNVLIKSYPIGIGKIATRTPVGRYVVVNKVPYPYSGPGGPLSPYPYSGPGGPLSPYGTLWMGLSRPGYGIHGTNRPSSIGKMVSKGCIRMYNKDVEDLGRRVGIDTPVNIHL
jgi:lipoprotein-anchoring transpeptidase ErfK/SrfK